MTVTLYCTDRGTHDPVIVYVYDGAIPVPSQWVATPRRSELDLLCDRSRGGCGRAPRPGTARLRAVIEAVADTPSAVLADISNWEL
jgi:hypothetical protein